MHLVARITTGLSMVLLLACCGVWLLLSAPRFGLEALVIPTGSMRPTMPVGSLALIHQVPASSLRVGDVVTYVDPLNPHKTITHRIIKTFMIGGVVPGIMTKGDANSAPDLPVPDGSVEGEVAWHIPVVGRMLAWVRSWVGTIVLVYVPALLVIIEEIKRLRDYYRSSLPYRLAGYRRAAERSLQLPKLAAVPLACIALVSIFAWQPLAAALPVSDVIALSGNHISAKAAHNRTRCRDDDNESGNNDSSQNADPGQASNQGSNSNGGAQNGNGNKSNSDKNNTSAGNGC
jgi:signal peptidase I